MLSFAAAAEPALTRVAALGPAEDAPIHVLHEQADESVHAQDGRGSGVGGSHGTYWPCELLNAFILKMAAAGHCVNTAMMLGYRPYAMEQLALARDVRDDSLHALAQRLQTYFDAEALKACSAVPEFQGA